MKTRWRFLVLTREDSDEATGHRASGNRRDAFQRRDLKVRGRNHIRACAVEWANVDVTGDPSPIEACVADDYEGVSSRSEVRNRAQLLKPFKPRPGLVSNTLDYIHIRFPSPEVAIAQGGETAVAKDGSRASLIWTDVWMLRGGRWQIVTSQDSRLPKPHEPPH